LVLQGRCIGGSMIGIECAHAPCCERSPRPRARADPGATHTRRTRDERSGNGARPSASLLSRTSPLHVLSIPPHTCCSPHPPQHSTRCAPSHSRGVRADARCASILCHPMPVKPEELGTQG
jgi:hypothetical protein